MKKMLLAIAFVVAIPACHKENSKNMPAKNAPKKTDKMHKEHATKAQAKAQPKNMPAVKKYSAKQ